MDETQVKEHSTSLFIKLLKINSNKGLLSFFLTNKHIFTSLLELLKVGTKFLSGKF